MRVPAVLLAAAFLLAGCAAERPFLRRAPDGGPAYRDFRWPLTGTVASGFGGRSGRPHNGIDILAPEGTPVRASESGFVSYAGDRLRGFGNAVLLDHGGDASTLYAHLREIHVESGEVVAAGSVIGSVGRTGNATTPHLHFELRLEGIPVDPADYLRRAEATE
jgi:murein DD-endopeptidase MepM/ murein hydrolase activator NlpD